MNKITKIGRLLTFLIAVGITATASWFDPNNNQRTCYGHKSSGTRYLHSDARSDANEAYNRLLNNPDINKQNIDYWVEQKMPVIGFLFFIPAVQSYDWSVKGQCLPGRGCLYVPETHNMNQNKNNSHSNVLNSLQKQKEIEQQKQAQKALELQAKEQKEKQEMLDVLNQIDSQNDYQDYQESEILTGTNSKILTGTNSKK